MSNEPEKKTFNVSGEPTTIIVKRGDNNFYSIGKTGDFIFLIRKVGNGAE